MWFIFGIILFILFFLLCVKISVTIQGVYGEQRKSFVVSISIFSKAIKKTFNIYPSSKKTLNQEAKEGEEQNYSKEPIHINQFIKNFHQLHTMGKRLLKRISIDSLSWQTSFSLGDAMQTGVAAGSLWAFKGGIIGFLSTYFALKKNVEIDVKPVFQGKGLYTEAKTTISFRLLFIILSVIPIYLYWRKMKKGVEYNESSN